jgi:hypothetical protein
MKSSNGVIVGFVFVVLGLLIVVHHFLICGRLFDLRDMLHHEFFEAILLTAGTVLLITELSTRKQT